MISAKRLGFVPLAIVLTLLVTTSSQAKLPQPISFWSSVAATISGPGQPQSNLRVIRPSAILMFADGSWDIDHLHWTGWGSGVAHATGISSASNGIPNEAQGKRITRPAQVTLSNPGRFQGHEVYRCFQLTVPAFPASDQRLCLTRMGGEWFLGPAAPPPPQQVDFLAATIDGGCEIDASGQLGIPATGEVFCETYGSAVSQKVVLTANGRVKICTQRGNSGQNRCDQGNFGDRTPQFKVGRQARAGGFRCQVLRAGVRCSVISSGKGFLINKTHTSLVP